jgi:hypothetical protein
MPAAVIFAAFIKYAHEKIFIISIAVYNYGDACTKQPRT